MLKKTSKIILLICICNLIFFSNNISVNTNLQKPVKTFDVENLPYFDLINSAFHLTTDEVKLLEQNKFIVLNRLGSDDILDLYSYYWHHDLPIMITTDSMLQVWHLIYDKLLETAEEYIFYPILKQMVLDMFNSFSHHFNMNQLNNEMISTLLFITVGAKLVDPGIYSPEIVRVDVNTLISAIYNEIPVANAILELQSNLTKRYIDDFSMYKPRGHYALNENLEQYFRLFKWFSRIPFFFDDYPGFKYLKTTPQQMIRSSIYLLYLMDKVQINLPDLGLNANGIQTWDGIKNFLDSLIGKTHTILPADILNAVSLIKQNSNWKPTDIDNNDIELVKENILNNNLIDEPHDTYLIDALNPEVCVEKMLQENKDTCSPKVFHLFGERLMPDTYVFNHLVSPYVVNEGEKKLFPHGLEFASVILNSSKAQTYLDDIYSEKSYWEEYATKISQMNKYVLNNSATENSLTWKLYNSLQTLAEPFSNKNIELQNIPEAMKTSAWEDEKLTTVLGSWAQLKHDSILYAKQGLTYGMCSTPEGYVEPYPEFYHSLEQVSTSFKESILQLTSLGFNVSTWRDVTRGPWDESTIYLDVFDKFSEVLLQLETIASKEVHNQPLSEEEKLFINSTYGLIEAGTYYSAPGHGGWLGRIFDLLLNSPVLNDYPDTRASTVADIHTCLTDECTQSSKEVLEVAVGYLENLITIVPGYNGSDILVIGPVYSYYEFIVPVEYRMTDQDWRAILLSKQNETLSASLNYDIFERGFWSESYMVDNQITYDILNHTYILEEAYRRDEIFGAEWFLGGEFASSIAEYDSTAIFASSIAEYDSTAIPEYEEYPTIQNTLNSMIFIAIPVIIVSIYIKREKWLK